MSSVHRANRAYYNDNDPYCCEWLRNLAAAGLIPDGDVDERSIADVQPGDLQGYTQVHLFAGLGGWAYAARLAGWPDGRPLWTGSCPCQPFSVAGKRKGADDPRHLWPHFYRLIRAARPPVVLGEQVGGKAGYVWLAGVGSDLEAEGYAWRAVDIPACGVGAPHIRSRLYWVANTAGPRGGAGFCEADAQRYWHGLTSHSGRTERVADTNGRTGLGGESWAIERAGIEGSCGGVDDAHDPERRPNEPQRHIHYGPATRRREGDGNAQGSGGADSGMEYAPFVRRGEGWTEHAIRGRGNSTASAGGSFWDSWVLVGPDPQGKYRRVKPGVRLLAHGIPARVAKLRALGNAIVPQLAAEVLRAYMETCPERPSVDTPA